jgi:transposase
MNIFLKLTEDYGSQKKAALAIDVSTSTFSEWINKVKAPGKKNIKKLREAGFSAEEIFDSCFTEK